MESVNEKDEPKRRKRERAPPSPNAFSYTIADAQAMGAPSRSTIYKLAKAGRLELIKAPGLETRIIGDSLRRLLLGGGL